MPLLFVDFTKDAFQFLEERYGYKCTDSSSWLIKYETKDVFVCVEFDGTRSFEISCSVGRQDNFKGSSQLPFDLGEIMRSQGVAAEDAHAAFQVTTNQTLKKFLVVLATQLDKYGQDMLLGNDHAFSEVSIWRDTECMEYAQKTKMRQIRSMLQVAWGNRDYLKVIDLLDPVNDFLSDTEKKKLHYAKSHL